MVVDRLAGCAFAIVMVSVLPCLEGYAFELFLARGRQSRDLKAKIARRRCEIATASQMRVCHTLCTAFSDALLRAAPVQ